MEKIALECVEKEGIEVDAEDPVMEQGIEDEMEDDDLEILENAQTSSPPQRGGSTTL